MYNEVCQTNFISITKNYLYEEGVFTTKQDEHHQYITKVLSETHEEISDNMNHLYNFFKSDGPNVQKHGTNFVIISMGKFFKLYSKLYEHHFSNCH